MKSVLILFFCLCAISGVQAQVQNDVGFPEPIRKDTVCFRYQFLPGDQLVYRVVSYDTIQVKEQEPLLKERVEMLRLVCDSIGRNGHFYLRQTLTDYISRESLGDTKKVTRTESPWVGRTAFLEIDPLGRRYFSDMSQSEQASALAPGGAFQPALIAGIYESCHLVHKTWMADQITDLLPENGSPAPVRRHSLLYTAAAPVDTLGFVCDQFQYALTGQGNIEVTDRKPALRVSSIIAEHGDMQMSREYGVPVHFYATSQLKMEIVTSNGALVKSTQYIKSHYTLEELHRSGKVIKAKH